MQQSEERITDMLNIFFKGNYTSDEQLIKRKQIPDDAVEYAVVPNLNKVFGKGVLLTFSVVCRNGSRNTSESERH